MASSKHGISGLVAGLLVLTALAAGGCGGAPGRKVREPMPAEPEDDAPPAAAATQPAKPVGQPPTPLSPSPQPVVAASTAGTVVHATQAAATRPADDSVLAGATAPVEKPQPPDKKAERPDGVADWKPDDYRTAHAERDARLVEAVRQLDTAWPGDENNGTLLAGLLEAELKFQGAAEAKTAAGTATPSKTYREGPDGEMLDEPPPRRGAAGAANIAELDAALVQALGANGGNTARETLKRLLLGKLPAGSRDQVLSEATLKTLCENYGPENEKLLYTVLTVPDRVRPAGRGLVTADELQKQCVELVAEAASERLRTALAQYVTRAVADDPARQRTMAMLVRPDPRNLEAQAMLWSAQSVNETTKLGLLDVLGACGRQAMAGMLRQTPRSRTDAESEEPSVKTAHVSLAEAQRIAGRLWRGPFVSAVEARMAALADLSSDMNLVQLAGNLPVTEVRTHFCDLLKSHWTEGTEYPAIKKLLDQSPLDPGFLLVAKSMPREDRPEKRDTDEQRQGAATGSESRKPNSAWEKAKKERDARYAWMDACQRLVQEWNQRCAAAAAAPPENVAPSGTLVSGDTPLTELATDDPFDGAPDADEDRPAKRNSGAALPRSVKSSVLPFELHPGARVAAEFRLDWPADLPATLSGVAISPISLRYLRVVVTDRFTKLQHYYGRHLRHDHPLKNGRWLESQHTDSETGQLRSIDVMITRAASEKAAPKEGAERLVVEILAIAIPNPTTN